MRTDVFDFDLPLERIAQRPAEPRDASRLLVVDPSGGAITDSWIRDLPQWIEPGSVMVLNDTRVRPARLIGHKEGTGGRVELLLVTRESDPAPCAGASERWKALGKASKAFRFPSAIQFGNPPCLRAVVEGRAESDGLLRVTLTPIGAPSVSEVVRRIGHVPLPPYIRRADDAHDVDAYQTIYARSDGAVAAPTAGLHLTHALLGALSARGIHIVTLTLHVGLGTFLPVTADDLDDHRMHEEWYEIPQFAARSISQARERGARVVAVGTTTLRALEASADPARTGCVRPGSALTRLLIQPGYRFRVVDALLTNFHLPRSTLLALVAAMAGTDTVLRAYRHAVQSDYRFFSYGDAMFIAGCAASERRT